MSRGGSELDLWSSRLTAPAPMTTASAARSKFLLVPNIGRKGLLIERPCRLADLELFGELVNRGGCGKEAL